MAKKRASSSIADRTDEKNKRNARRPIYATNKKEALYSAAGAAAGAAGVAASNALKKSRYSRLTGGGAGPGRGMGQGGRGGGGFLRRSK